MISLHPNTKILREEVDLQTKRIKLREERRKNRKHVTYSLLSSKKMHILELKFNNEREKLDQPLTL